MRRFFRIVLAVFAMSFMGHNVSAQDADSIAIEIDSIAAIDSVVGLDPDPEWYVAPLVREADFAPHRAKAANCPVDSVLTFNVDSVLVEVTMYEYGDTTRTMIWTVNADGSRVGKSRTESASTATTSYSATYAWDASSNNWKGTSKEEHTYAGSKETERILYNTWLNNDWLADTKYTWTYDAAGREHEYTTYTRNTSTNQLVLSKQRIREWYNASKTTLDIQYTAHNGTTWSAGTKKVYDYDASGNQIEYTYYSSLSNGNWVGSTHEQWTYTSGKKTYYEKQTWSSGAWSNSTKEIWAYNGPSAKQTLYEKYTWSNSAWVGSSKEIWEYNGPSNKQTLHEKFGWSNGNWSLTLQENLGYDAAGNNTLVENYNVSNGTFTGSKKEEYTYNAAKKKIITIKYKWSSGAFVYNTKAVTDFDAAGNSIETANYTWSNGAWKGTGTRTLTTFNSNKKETEKITQTWPTNATDWVNATRKTTEYEGTRTTQEASYTWSTDLNAWVGTSRSDWHYNAAGQNDTIKTYTPNGTEWIFSSRIVKTYDAKGNNTLTHNAQWNTSESKWQMTSMSKLEIAYDASNRQILNATWQCSSDSIWIGVQKDTASYTASGKSIYTARYTSWANGDWVPSYYAKYEYDDAERTLLYMRMDWVNGKWKGNFKYDYEYNAQGAEIMSAYYGSWNSNTDSWGGTSKKETVYNSAGLVESTTNYDWKNNDWSATNKYLYYYNANNQTIERVVQNYTNGAWVNSLRYETLTQGTTVKSNDYKWLNNNWQYSRRSEKTYDNDAAAKLRREITGSWNNNGVLTSFTDKQYSYSCDPHNYTIRFVNYNGEELASYSLESGQTPSYSGTEPTKPEDAEYTYTFSGWSPTVIPAAGNATYTATFTGTKRTYTITWLNEDGTQLGQETLEYGATPAHADMSKDNTVEYTYNFKGWKPGIGIVTGDATYTADFDSIKNKYTITWVDDNDVQLDQMTIEYGVMPEHADAEKAATAEWTYSFTGWTPAIVSVTGNATYKATFSQTKNTYTVTWLNDDDSEIAKETLEYGATPSHADMSKDNTAEWTYAFTGWTPAITSVTGDATYKATFSQTKNKYVITFLNYDGTELQSGEVEYGVTPEFTGATPTKPADAQGTYTFTGWDEELAAVTGTKTYTAQFFSTANKYTIIFQNYDGTELQRSEVEYGELPNFEGEDPTKPADAQDTYNFAGWDPQVVPVTGTATYTAQYTSTVNSYTIKFMNGDTELQSSEVAYGETPVYTGAKPTKDATAQYTYDFSGWDSEIVAVTGAKTYNATFSSTVNKYTITFLNYDDTELQTGEVAYGETPEYTGATPTKPADAQDTYTFAGWSPEIAAVTGTATYTAQFNGTTNKYLITFKNGETELQSSEVDYGETPSYTGTTPTKAATAQYTYTFSGWDPAIVAVTGIATYEAQFSSTVNKYTIKFMNGETELQSSEVAYGETPVYTAATPTKDATAQYTYTFAGWDKEIASVTGDETYTAQFSSMVNSYTVTWVDENDIEISHETLEYGATPSHADMSKDNTAEWTYNFEGWTPAIVDVTGDATYKATFSQTKNSYTVTWVDENDIEISHETLEYGATPSHADASKDNTAEWTYSFTGWTPAIVDVTGDATYKATFSQTKNSYTITWLDENDIEISHETLEYGATPQHADASKQNTAEYTYTFTGWTPAIVDVTGDATYKATFSQTKNSYTVTWVDENDIEISHETLEYGATPSHADASKDNTAEWTYNFEGWTPAIVDVTGDATYKATFSQTKNSYTVTWVDENDIEISHETLEYGATPSHADMSKDNTAEWTYNFEGWTPAIVDVTGDATYKATFSQTKNSYTVTWVDENDIEISHETLEYGATPSHADASKDNTAEWTYSFTGWTPAIVDVTGDATYKATFSQTKNSYIVTWVDENDIEISHETLEYGATPSHADMSKDNTAEWTYNFEGWTPAIVDVTGDATYKATFSQTKNTYTITFLNYDGTELQTGDVEYGVVPTYTSATPTKPADAQGTYTFAGWDEEIAAVTGAKTYTATFTGVKGTYTITFYFGDGVTILAQMELAYGEMPEMTLEPARLSDPEFSYTFAGWEPAIAPVTADADYVAVYTATTNSYTIIFRNDDGTELQRDVLEYGILPIYAGEEPTKEEDERYTYEFAGWKPAVDIAKADAVYTATYTATKKKKQGIEDVVESGTQATKIYIEGNIYIMRAGHAYAPDGTKLY